MDDRGVVGLAHRRRDGGFREQYGPIHVGGVALLRVTHGIGLAADGLEGALGTVDGGQELRVQGEAPVDGNRVVDANPWPGGHVACLQDTHGHAGRQKRA